MTKIQQFINDVKVVAEKVGATRPGILCYDYKVDTKVGLYSFSAFHKPDEKRVRVYSIVGRFEEPERAARVYVEVNPFSGKYNFHRRDADDCLGMFIDLLKDATGKDIIMDTKRISVHKESEALYDKLEGQSGC